MDEAPVSEPRSVIEQPSYFCYKAYIKGAGYAMFIVYSALGIKRIHEHIKQYFLVERCVSCRVYGVSNVELMFWGAFDALLYALIPIAALVAMIDADLEWFFPSCAVRALFPSFMLIWPAFCTIISYITFWSIDLAIDVQQLPEDLFDMVVWKRCIWAGALFVANIYAFLLTCVVLQLVYYQHCIVIEEQILREQRQALNDRERFRNLRRQRMRFNQRLNAIPVADVHIQNIEIV